MQPQLLKDFLSKIPLPFSIAGHTADLWISSVKPVTEADPHSLVWVDPNRRDAAELVSRTASRAVICNKAGDELLKRFPDKCFIVVDNPKYFIHYALENVLYPVTVQYGIHPTAFVDNEAVISEKASIGPFTYIGKAEISEGVVIAGHVHIRDQVKIGKNVKIQAGCVIGSDAINRVYDENGNIHHFHHIGGVIIGDNCRIDALTHIDRGALGDTVIGSNVAIDNNVYIAHNCKIGNNTIIIGHSMISGSVTVGENCWIGPGTTVRDQIRIGNNCFIGTGSVVVKNVDDNMNIMGNPAVSFEEFHEMRSKLKKL